MRTGRERALNLAWSTKRLAGCHSTPQLDEQFVLLKFNKDQADALAWLAAKRAAGSGAHTVIASGREPDVLVRLAEGECIGTELRASMPLLSARKQWIADHLQLRGRVTVDAGAALALTRDNKSLLPIGVIAVEGEFDRGDVVACVDESGRELARGLINYSSGATRRIMRHPSSQIEALLGSMEEPELMHRDNMVIR